MQNQLNFGFPEIKPCLPDADDLPIMSSYLYRSNFKVQYPGIMHFFTDDFRFNSIWTQRKQFIAYLYNWPGIKYIVSPDFSTYIEAPRAVQIYNLYRKAELSKMMQSEGYKVIPSLSWSDVASFSYAFDGLPSHGCYALPFRRDDDNIVFWSGLFYFIRRFEPVLLLIFCAERNRSLFHTAFQIHNQKLQLKTRYIFLSF